MKHLNRRFGKQPRKFNYTIVFRSATIQQVLRASHRASKCTVLPCSLHARRPRSPPLLISPGAGRTCVSVRCLVRTNHLQARDEGTRPMLSLPLLLHPRRSLRSPQPHVTAPHSPVPRTREVGCGRTQYSHGPSSFTCARTCASARCLPTHPTLPLHSPTECTAGSARQARTMPSKPRDYLGG